MTDWPPRPPNPTVVICLHISLLSLLCKIAMQQPSLMLNTSYKSVQKGQRYHLYTLPVYAITCIRCTKMGQHISTFFYIVLITLASGQTAQNVVEIRS